jgi:hypothetical protein
MDELELPEHVRQKAAVTPGGEHAWRIEDVEDAIDAGRKVGLACLGGQVQFQFDGGTCEAYWLSYEPEDRQAGESWRRYVVRSTEEVRAAFRRVCQETDFRRVALNWKFIRQKVETEACDPLGHLRFVLYFKRDEPRS